MQEAYNMFTALQSSILAVLTETPHGEIYLHELGRRLGKKPGIFQNSINALDKQGLILSRREGNRRFIRINEQHPLCGEIKAMVRKTAGVEAILKKAVGGISGIVTAVIYGSYAKGALRPDSDIDLLVIAQDGSCEDELVDELARVEKALGRDVNYKFYEQQDFARRRENSDPFLCEVLSGKYMVVKGAV
jgi:predicted nucleotidyltransferase